MKTLTVYCGSSTSLDSVFHDAAVSVGEHIASNKLSLVYGGGSIGLMGTVARTASKNGSHVHGVITEKFVELDVPFHVEERKQRLDLVRSSLSNPKVTASEQVRQILEAYNIESEYGRKIDAFESSIVIDGQEIVANVLVIGRIGMFYQTKDERTSGIWDKDANDWVELDSGYRTAIRDGIRMAKKLAPTDMLLMPIVKGEL